MDCSPPGSSVCGILQARILELVAMPLFRGSLLPREGIEPESSAAPALQVVFFFFFLFTTEPPGKPLSVWPYVIKAAGAQVS